MTLYTKDGKIKTRQQIVIRTDEIQIINPTEEMLLEDGWEIYVPDQTAVERKPSKFELIENLIIKQFNERTDISNEDALTNAILVYEWNTYIGKSLNKGQIVSYDDLLYRIIQDINVVNETEFPSINTSALYEVIDKEHSGTIEDPIPFNPPMEIFVDKYYSQNDVIYLCTRNSENPLSYNLSDLVGLYVEQI